MLVSTAEVSRPPRVYECLIPPFLRRNFAPNLNVGPTNTRGTVEKPPRVFGGADFPDVSDSIQRSMEKSSICKSSGSWPIRERKWVVNNGCSTPNLSCNSSVSFLRPKRLRKESFRSWNPQVGNDGSLEKQSPQQNEIFCKNKLPKRRCQQKYKKRLPRNKYGTRLHNLLKQGLISLYNLKWPATHESYRLSTMTYSYNT